MKEAKHGEYSILVLWRTAWLNVRTWFDFAKEIQSTLSHLNQIILMSLNEIKMHVFINSASPQVILWNCLVAFSQGSNENLHHIHFLPQRDARDNLLCSTDKETFFLTDSSQQKKHS